MDAKVLETTTKAHLTEMRARLDDTTGIAQAAEICAAAGTFPKAIELALDLEQILYKVNTFLNAASTMHRILKT